MVDAVPEVVLPQICPTTPAGFVTEYPWIVSCPPAGTCSGVVAAPAVSEPDPRYTATVPLLMIVTSFSTAVVATDPREPNAVELVFSGFQTRTEAVPMDELT